MEKQRFAINAAARVHMIGARDSEHVFSDFYILAGPVSVAPLELARPFVIDGVNERVNVITI